MNEKWEYLMDLVDCGYAYSVSNFGQVRNNITGRLMRQSLGYHQYYQVTLSQNGKNKKYSVHRLVALAFVKNLDDKPIVNHIDGIKTNNAASNLEWVTYSENSKHAVKIGLQDVPTGEDCHASKLTNKDVVKIKKMLIEGKPYQLIANKFGVLSRAISNIHREKVWKHVTVEGFTPNGSNRDKLHVKQPTPRLTKDMVKEIRELHSTGKYPHGTLANMFGTTRRNVTNIVNYSSWKHVD